MRSETVTTVLAAHADDVYEYLSTIDNLPEWANEFARELEWRDGDAVVRNGLGEFVFRIQADPETRVIDMLAGPTLNELATFPTRVVELDEAKAAFSFTMFQAPGMPDELFEAQHASLRREFENIEARFGRG